MSRPYREKSHFGTGLVIYVLIFLILTVVGLIFFFDWLKAYENTQPYNAVNAYEAFLRQNGLTPAGLASLTDVDREHQPDSEITRITKEVLSDAALYRSLSKGSSDRQAYLVHADGNTVGTVYFSPEGEKQFNFRAWVPVEEDFDFSAYYDSVSLKVPEGYTVSVNGVPLDEKNRTESGIRYQTLQDYYDEYSGLPTLVRYASGNLLGESVTTVTDGSGNPVSPDNLTESFFLDTCSNADRTRLSAFTREFISDYVQFTADVGGGHYYYYNEVRQRITPDSPLLDRMAQSLGSFGFTTTHSCKIIKDSVNICCPFAKNVFFVDYSYTTETVGTGSAVEDSRNVRLVMEDSSGQLLVREMTYY